MTKRQVNNYQEIRHPAGIKIMISELRDIFWYCCVNSCHGASSIARRKKRSGSAENALLPIIAFSTLIGSNARNLAVRSMVIMIETLRLPRLVMFPKDIFLSLTMEVA